MKKEIIITFYGSYHWILTQLPVKTKGGFYLPIKSLDGKSYETAFLRELPANLKENCTEVFGKPYRESSIFS